MGSSAGFNLVSALLTLLDFLPTRDVLKRAIDNVAEYEVTESRNRVKTWHVRALFGLIILMAAGICGELLWFFIKMILPFVFPNFCYGGLLNLSKGCVCFPKYLPHGDC